MEGYGGRLLRFDLDEGRVSWEPLSEEMARRYLGGRGFAAHILYDELQRSIDPLEPDKSPKRTNCVTAMVWIPSPRAPASPGP